MAVPDRVGQRRSFRGLPLRRRSTFPFVITQWSGSGTHTAFAYLYENVGIPTDPTKDVPGTVYLYENVGVGPRWSPVLGRVVAQPVDTYGVAYAYENVT